MFMWRFLLVLLAISLALVLTQAVDHEDITFLFGAINIGRKSHHGKSGDQYSFESDYLPKIARLANLLSPSPISIIIQRQYYDILAPSLDLIPKVRVQFVEVEDLRSFKYYNQLEKIRNDPAWIRYSGWLSGVPQGYTDLYNPIVMQKIYWMYDLALDNPFNTSYFVWLDSGPCSLEIASMGKQNAQIKLKSYLDKFLVTRSPYPDGLDIHGCPRSIITRFTRGIQPDFVSKGWILGGTRDIIKKVLWEYDSMLNQTLNSFCLGTEETVFTILTYRFPHLFNPYSNGHPRDLWQDVSCRFFQEKQIFPPTKCDTPDSDSTSS